LIALHGLASKIHDATQREYVAGLWIDNTLPISLLWRAQTKDKLAPKLANNRAPTWSWASIDGPIFFETAASKVQSVLIRVHGTVPLTSSVAQPRIVPIAYLKISGDLVEVKLRLVEWRDELWEHKGFLEWLLPCLNHPDMTWVEMYMKYGGDLRAVCHLDRPLDRIAQDTVLCLPVVRRRNIEGLFLRRVSHHADYYQLIGYFSWRGFGMTYFWKRTKGQTVILI
jgi:hypothetical protein